MMLALALAFGDHICSSCLICRGFVYVLISALVGTQGIIQARASHQTPR